MSALPCPHTWSDGECLIPHYQQLVHRDECAYCCRQCHQEDGIYVCMICFSGMCKDHIEKHQSVEPRHNLFVRIKELPAEKKPSVQETKDVHSLCVVPQKRYETDMYCAKCRIQYTINETTPAPGVSAESYTSIINAPAPGVAREENDMEGLKISSCSHVLLLEQTRNPFASGVPPTKGGICCVESGCACTENCWMCMSCGFIGCPRSSVGGNGHALAHSLATGHPCCVKLGTITPSGADVYCYSCDDMIRDEYLEKHMNFFGIDVASCTKTAKTMGELEYDHSTSFDFNQATEAGENIVLVRGPGRIGIQNIGNSCYISSVLQCILAIPAFKRAFFPSEDKFSHRRTCTANPYSCCHCQLERLGEGLFSGKFGSSPRLEDVSYFVPPRLVKSAIAGMHPDFSSGTQQDAQEYLLFLLQKLQGSISLPKELQVAGPKGTDVIHPSCVFQMRLRQSMECTHCHKSRHRLEEDSSLSLSLPALEGGKCLKDLNEKGVRPTFSLEQCIESTLSLGSFTCRCESCGRETIYNSTTRFETFPDVLVVYIRRAFFDTATLATKKYEVFVEVPEEIDLTPYRAENAAPGNIEVGGAISRARTEKNEVVKKFDDEAIALVTSMGFEIRAAQFALEECGGNVENAIDYLCSGVDIDRAMSLELQAEEENKAEQARQLKAAEVNMKVFTDGIGKYHLTSMVSHIGPRAKMGHYVAHVKERSTGKWLLFNDEKVGLSVSPPFTTASIYFFERATVTV